MRLKLWAGILLLVAAMAADAAPKKKQQRTVNTANKEKTATQQKIKETEQKIKTNASQTEKSLAELQLLSGEIDAKERQIASAQAQVDSLNEMIATATDSIARLNDGLKEMERTYIHALRRLQGSQYATNILAYIFSSDTFHTAYSRLRYLREFADWRKRRVAEIQRVRAEIETQRNQLAGLQSERTAVLASLNSDQAVLVTKRNETDRLVTRLKSDGRNLQAALAKEKQRLASIDNEITRMMQQEEQERKKRQEADRKKKQQQQQQPKKNGQQQSTPPKNNSGSGSATPPSTPPKPSVSVDNSDPDAAMTAKFNNAKGSMTFPVPSPYRIVSQYGASAGRPFNTGIEIVCDGAPTARSIYEGTVSRIFENTNGNYTVMVRHGAYISVYYNIQSLSVKSGAKVSAGQALGTVAMDSRLGKPMLHFEIRKGSQTVNPTPWLR
ncbi:MAG: peptidoglycan DD-metalloendopeptidase family protein [Paramuribaculum sp.]|nr:peptidoglycan DD-metalloendopeptidase family protein [Paramuribaculum sp.]